TPAGSRASSRHASIAPRITSARGPSAWGAPRTRTAVQRHVDGIPKGSHHVRVPHTALSGGSSFWPGGSLHLVVRRHSSRLETLCAPGRGHLGPVAKPELELSRVCHLPRANAQGRPPARIVARGAVAVAPSGYYSIDLILRPRPPRCRLLAGIRQV